MTRLATGAETEVLTPELLHQQLEAPAGHGSNADAAELATRIRVWFGENELRAGPEPKIEQLTAAWTLEAASAHPSVTTDDGTFRLPLTRVGTTDVSAGVTTLPWGTAMRRRYEVEDAAQRTSLYRSTTSFS
jgi:hypothetical protein